MQHGLVIGSTRLFAAADYLLSDAHENRNMHTAILMETDPPDHEFPRARSRFTRMELVEAMCVLVRMGYADAEGNSL